MRADRPSLTRAIPYACLVLSGAASLVYELTWIRQLTLIFGGTLYAISAVLCAFMAGLALGAWVCARYLNRPTAADSQTNLVRLYGLLEGLIGLYGLLFPLALELLSQLYPFIFAWTAGEDGALHLIEFFLSALLMLPATSLMGATLPIIGSWAIAGRTGHVFSKVSVLYSLNTFGAVGGCLFAQLFALKYLGVQMTSWSAVTMNLLVFLLCFTLKEKKALRPAHEPPHFAKVLGQEKGDDPAPSPALSAFLLCIFTYSGMASLASEILWTRVLLFPMGSTLYSFALILATFLFSIALGSLIAEKLLGRSRLILKFLLVELAIGILCIAILPLFDHLAEWTLQADRIFYDLENSAAKTLWVRSLFAFGLMFLPALGFGLIFPLANRIHLSMFGTVSRTLGNSYAVNTLGAVLGTVLTPFFFVPLFGIRLSVFIIYSILILLAAAGLLMHIGWRPARGISAGILTAMLIFCGYAWSTPRIATDRVGDHNLARTEIDVPKEQIHLLDYKEGAFSTLSVVEDTFGARTIYLDGFSTATVSASFGASAYMQAMGFIPMALHPDPQKALVIGFGTGNTLGTAALFPGVQIDAVEIDRNVLSMAHWFEPWNHDVLSKPNVHTHIQDGRIFTRWTPNTYDVITLEPMSPVQAGVVNLYSRDFYELASRKLNAGGLMMQWVPLHLVGPDDARAIIKTFQEVFPHTTIWNSFLTRIVLIVGSNEPIVLDKSHFDRLMDVPALNRAAEQMGVQSFLDFADFYLTDGKPVEKALQDAPVITDDLPILEHSPVTLLPPLKWQTDESFINLLRHRVNRFPVFAGVSAEEEYQLRRDLNTRAAQRFAIFSRRYHGPGEQAFAAQNYPAGLEAISIYLDRIKDAPISLQNAAWDD